MLLDIPTTPAIKLNDVFVIISGSGSTEHLRLLADKAKSVGADIVLITTNKDSAIGNLAGTKHRFACRYKI